jgi:thiol-disulfide isomerase/thioredoxin
VKVAAETAETVAEAVAAVVKVVATTAESVVKLNLIFEKATMKMAAFSYICAKESIFNEMKLNKWMLMAGVVLACAVGCKNQSEEEKLAEFNAWNDSFMEEYRAHLTENAENADAVREYTEAKIEEYKEYNLTAVRKNAKNAVGIAAFRNVYGLLDDDSLFECLDLVAPHVHGEDSTFVYRLKESLSAKVKTAEGQMFTDFEVNGVKFSDFIGQGKYVLVDFWASWCGPCRGEMPNLRAVYEEFHGDKFDMLSVAVWDRLEDTIEAAKEENIVWNQIMDAQKVPTDIYGIDGIPHIILFGPDGTILKRNLRGEAIRKAVAEALDD